MQTEKQISDSMIIEGFHSLLASYKQHKIADTENISKCNQIIIESKMKMETVSTKKFPNDTKNEQRKTYEGLIKDAESDPVLMWELQYAKWFHNFHKQTFGQ